ncbi:TfoX/Sxy family protein [Nocardioides scoriae]|uniref:TfoX/Sxy family protein n=1 Tax=Nocardioides scoriae TaxID=642780 RepID=UPI001E469763|nr:TfoX/Sxy family protein [Nocardioides scoriae]
MRIGTWNLEGRWDERDRDLLREMDCDLLLLTEVRRGTRLDDHEVHLTAGDMAGGRAWAAVASRAADLEPRPDPHGASAMAVVDGVGTCCSSILPWRSCGTRAPWVGATTAERTAEAVASVEAAGPVVWGGDWNNALRGPDWSGSRSGRDRIREAVRRLGLVVPTSALPHHLPDLCSIDHIGVPEAWERGGAARIAAEREGRRISDHDAYVVEVAVPQPDLWSGTAERGHPGPMAYDVELADRVRDVLETTDELDVPSEVREKKMFGGLAFLVEDHMAVAVSGQGGLMLRVEPEQGAALLAEPGVEPMVMRGRAMGGWLRVTPEACEGEALRRWVEVGLAGVRALPGE